MRNKIFTTTERANVLKQFANACHNLWYAHASHTADQVIALANKLDNISQDDMYQRIDKLRSTVSNGKLNHSLVESFALTYIASKRVLGLTPHKVQLIAGIALHQGNIAEQKTGEGKTLTAAFPAVLHALEGKGVHIVTVNPYLADRDANNIGRLFTYLGLTVGCVTDKLSPTEKKIEYSRDIVYVPNSELGFDYLRDNMATAASRTVLRDLHYAIVDEADSILIDEARTPLIIAGDGKDVTPIYRKAYAVVAKLKEGSESKKFNRGEAFLGIERKEFGDFIVHEKERNVILTATGIKQVEKSFGIKRYADKQNRAIQHAITQSLYARCLMTKGKDYIVKDGDIALIDEFTGRISEGRQYSDGLHQAIQAKEGVDVSPVNDTVGTITYQNFFRKFKTLSGMTGTAWTDRKELKSTYGLIVRRIPTDKPMIREDKPDVLFLTKAAKWSAVADRIVEAKEAGQPVLVGTASVEESEAMSKALKERNIKHQVLNAKQDAAEAEIIANAGKSGTVTVATNMAGRGTDIVLDDEARKAGGLLVIGTEKHESERIDNQLRGRSGRQGDPGESVFYVSTEDRVMRLYGSDRYRKMLEKLKIDADKSVDIPSIMRNIKYTQRKVEEDYFAMRRDTLEYDDVNDMQRESIYKERRKILNKDDVSEDFKYCVKQFVANTVNELGVSDKAVKAVALLTAQASEVCEVKPEGKKKEFTKRLCDAVLGHMKNMQFSLQEERNHQIRQSMLIAIDSAWTEHLKALEFCKDAVGYAGYGQLDPKAVYAHEAYKLYDKLQRAIYSSSVYLFFSGYKSSATKIQTDDGKLKLKHEKGLDV